MSEAESAAIIGHELGHFAAGDTAHGASLSLLQRQVRLRIERIAAPRMGMSACSASRACGPRCTSSIASSAPTCTGIAARNWPPTRSGRG
ncbi:M48 family metalloprotease [Pseudomonas aeruginosa]|nr:M48 family metalloprotease [Pseudomonas aeruginosa]